MTPSDSVCAEAAAWIAKLHSTRRDRELEAGLRRWLAESSEHRTAFEYANEMWSHAEHFPRVEVPLQTLLRREQPSHRPLALAASFVALSLTVGLVFWYLSDPAYSTGVGEQRIVMLDDGTRITLNTRTRLRVRYDTAARNIDLIEGEALFDIARDAIRPLTVNTTDQRILALGTSFVARHDARITAVTLLSGKVSVATTSSPFARDGRGAGDEGTQGRARGQGEEPIILTPGERLTLHILPAREQSKIPSTGEAIIDTPRLETITAWQRGQIIFDHTPLATAIQELNRYSTTTIVLAAQEEREGARDNGKGEILSDIQITGIFKAGDSEYFAQALASTHQLALTKEGKKITLGSPTP